MLWVVMGFSGILIFFLVYILEEYKIKFVKNVICVILSFVDIIDEECLSVIMGVEY